MASEVRVIYRDPKTKHFASYQPNKLLIAEVYKGKKKIFTKKGYFDMNYTVDAEKFAASEDELYPFEPKNTINFVVKSKGLIWDQIPMKDIRRKLRRSATSDRLRLHIRARVKGETLSFTHEFIAPINPLQLPGRGKALNTIRDAAAFQIKRAIFDALITDITKLGYRMSGKAKIDKSTMAESLKEQRKQLPLLRSAEISIAYE